MLLAPILVVAAARVGRGRRRRDGARPTPVHDRRARHAVRRVRVRRARTRTSTSARQLRHLLPGFAEPLRRDAPTSIAVLGAARARGRARARRWCSGLAWLVTRYVRPRARRSAAAVLAVRVRRGGRASRCVALLVLPPRRADATRWPRWGAVLLVLVAIGVVGVVAPAGPLPRRRVRLAVAARDRRVRRAVRPARARTRRSRRTTSTSTATCSARCCRPRCRSPRSASR